MVVTSSWWNVTLIHEWYLDLVKRTGHNLFPSDLWRHCSPWFQCSRWQSRSLTSDWFLFLYELPGFSAQLHVRYFFFVLVIKKYHQGKSRCPIFINFNWNTMGLCGQHRPYTSGKFSSLCNFDYHFSSIDFGFFLRIASYLQMESLLSLLSSIFSHHFHLFFLVLCSSGGGRGLGNMLKEFRVW